MLRRYFLPVGAATLWIALSEFLRNEVLLKTLWVDHYASMGLTFPDAPINGAVWGLWSLGLAIVLCALLTRFSPMQAGALAWGAGFGLMWIVIGNMGVLPFGILPYAVPLSLLEVGLAVWILGRFSR